MDLTTISLALRLDASEVLIRALDDHIRTCELAKKLARDREELLARNRSLRLLYAEVVHAQQEQMRMDLALAGWEEIRVSVWRSPQGKVYRGVAPAWHAMRGMGLA